MDIKKHPTENVILRKRDPPLSLRTQYRVQNETHLGKNQKVIKNDNDQLGIKNCPKSKQQLIQQPNFKLPYCHSCRQNNWLEFDKGWYCRSCENFINKQKHQIDKKVRIQDKYFSTRLSYANKKIRDIWLNMVNTTYKSTEDKINKLQELKEKTNLKFYKDISNQHDNMKISNFRYEEKTFTKNVPGISKISHEVLLLMKLLENKPQINNTKINYYDLYYTVIKNGVEKETIDNLCENKDNDYIKYEDFITPNHYIGKKNDNVMLS